MTQAYIIPPEDRPQLHLGLSVVEVLATSAQTAGEFSLLQTSTEPGGGPPLHLHRDAAEAFYVLEGEFLMYIDEQQTLCQAGTFVYVPRATPHTFKVVSDTPARKLNLFSPAAMVEYFEEMAALNKTGSVTPERLHDVAAGRDMEVLGPVPERSR